MPSLSDFPWKQEEGYFETKSVFKMIPAVNEFKAGQNYKIVLENGPEYLGKFKVFRYRKKTHDSPLVAVFLEFEISHGTIVIAEDKVKDVRKVDAPVVST